MLSYIQLAVYDMNKAGISDAPMVESQRVTDNILAFWGIADDMIASEQVRNIIKIGKRVERLDLYARLHMPEPDMQREVFRLADRVRKTDMRFRPGVVDALQTLVGEAELDCGAILKQVDSLLEA